MHVTKHIFVFLQLCHAKQERGEGLFVLIPPVAGIKRYKLRRRAAKKEKYQIQLSDMFHL